MRSLPIIEKARTDTGFRSRSGDHRLPSFVMLVIISIGFFLLIAIRLFQLSVVKGSYYRRLSEANRTKEIVIEARRGSLLDRNGRVITESKPPKKTSVKDRLVSDRVSEGNGAFGHAVGYIQLADTEALEHDRCVHKLQLGDSVGKKGVEKLYDCELRGINGYTLLELDATGIPVRTLGKVKPVDGSTIQLSIDRRLQEEAHRLFTENISSQSANFPKPEQLAKGALIALEPSTGKVLTLYSNPSFNPNDFNQKNTQRVNSYLKDPLQPLFNRATEGSYPPGSIFKLFVAAGALEERAMKPDTIIEDTGKITAGPITFGNWYFLQYGKTDGEVNLVKALMRSNDIYFYKAGEKLGVTDMKKWAERFGFGKATELPFPQAEGLLPSPFWKEEVLKEQWYLGDTYNLSIGQGYLLTTPIQIAQASAVFANNGRLCAPQLKQSDQPHCTKLPISDTTLSEVREGMRQACTAGGTGYPFFDFAPTGKGRIQVGCKTGTAESHGTGSQSPHAWFTVFAPFDKPTIAVTVLVENAGQGSDVAAPIAKEFLTAFFRGQ